MRSRASRYAASLSSMVMSLRFFLATALELDDDEEEALPEGLTARADVSLLIIRKPAEGAGDAVPLRDSCAAVEVDWSAEGRGAAPLPLAVASASDRGERMAKGETSAGRKVLFAWLKIWIIRRRGSLVSGVLASLTALVSGSM